MGTHPLLLLVALIFFTSSSPAATASPHISAVISQPGLDFAKDLLVSRAAETLANLSVPDIERSVRIPLIGAVRMVASRIVLEGVTVSNSTVAAGDTGVVVAASLTSVNITMEWSYSYSSWFVTVSDSGNASIQVEGMDVGVSMGMKNQNGSLKLFVMKCGCYMKDLKITLNGGASWFYQGFIDAFSNHIRSSVENAITNKIMEGASKLDLFLGSLPKEIDVDKVAAMNLTFVNDPLFKSSSVEFDIDGLFIPSNKTALPRQRHFGDSKFAAPLGTSSKMLWISLDEDVFNSVSALYFKAGLLQSTVNKIPDQFLLNTASWRFFIPRLYHRYPDKDMLLNISALSPPSVGINVGGIDATVDLDVTVNVLDFGDIVPVACISLSVAVSGGAVVSGNNLAGRVELDYFSFVLKWSKVGRLHTVMVQSVLRIFLKNLFVPYVNTYLAEGFPLPVIKGFFIRDAYILTSHSRIIVSSNVAFIETMKVLHAAKALLNIEDSKSREKSFTNALQVQNAAKPQCLRIDTNRLKKGPTIYTDAAWKNEISASAFSAGAKRKAGIGIFMQWLQQGDKKAIFVKASSLAEAQAMELAAQISNAFGVQQPNFLTNNHILAEAAAKRDPSNAPGHWMIDQIYTSLSTLQVKLMLESSRSGESKIPLLTDRHIVHSIGIIPLGLVIIVAMELGMIMRIAL